MTSKHDHLGRIGKEEPLKVAGEQTQPSVSLRWILSNLALSMLLSSLGTSIVNIALPTLAQAFTASFQEVQWIIIAYLLAIAIMIVSVGRLGDMIGYRSVMLAGIFLFTSASLLCGIAPVLEVLIAARMVQGVGAAILMVLTVAIVRETVLKENTGSAMGLLGTMSALGTALGPALGGILVANLGWRSIFLLMALLGVANFLLAYRYLPIHKRKGKLDRHDFDLWGTFFLGIALAAYALAVTVGGGHFDQLNVILLVVAILSGSLFVMTEARVTAPLIRLAAFRNVLLSTNLAMNALVATVMMATLVVGPFYLSQALGLEAAQVGIVMATGPIVSILSGVPAGRIVDRLGASFIVIFGLIEMAVGAFALSTLPALFGMGGYIAAIIVLTPGYQLFQAANNTAVMMDVPPDQRGVISGMLNLSRNLGLLTGTSVMGAVFTFASRTTGISIAPPEAVTVGMQTTFTVAALLIMIALGLAFGGRTLARRFP